jgi:hypothetical protein
MALYRRTCLQPGTCNQELSNFISLCILQDLNFRYHFFSQLQINTSEDAYCRPLHSLDRFGFGLCAFGHQRSFAQRFCGSCRREAQVETSDQG